MKKIIFIVILIALAIGGWYYFRDEVPEPAPLPPVEEIPPVPFDVEPPAEEIPVIDLDDDPFADAEPFALEDVTGGDATGQAWISVQDGKTYHRATALNLPELTGSDFYEGWLVRKPSVLGFFSTGEMTFDENEQMWVLDYVTDGDKSNYPLVVITLEPDDGDPGPAAHILEGNSRSSYDTITYES